MKLWLDDLCMEGGNRQTPEGWEGFTSPWKALDFVLRMGDEVDEWSLDHDLGENVPTGYDFLCMIELLVARGLDVHVPESITIHSDNPAGVRNMNRCLESLRRWT